MSPDRIRRSPAFRAASILLLVCVGIAILLGRPEPAGNLTHDEDRSSHLAPTEGLSPAAANGPELRFGMLREISRDRYLSPAGLIHGRGSAEGHRLEHLRRHVDDDPRRQGSHGVTGFPV